MKLLPLCPCAIKALLAYFNLSFSSRYSWINRLIKSNSYFSFFILHKTIITYIRIMILLYEDIIFLHLTFCLRFPKVNTYAANHRGDSEDIWVAVEDRCHLHFDFVHRLHLLTLLQIFLSYHVFSSNITVFVTIRMQAKPEAYLYLHLWSLLSFVSVKLLPMQKTSFVQLAIYPYSLLLQFNLYFLLDLIILCSVHPISCIFIRTLSLFLMKFCPFTVFHEIFWEFDHFISLIYASMRRGCCFPHACAWLSPNSFRLFAFFHHLNCFLDVCNATIELPIVNIPL